MAKPGPKPRIDSTDILDVFDRREDFAEPLTAPELADALACSRRTALNRLTDLADDGRLRSKQVGGRSRVYWVSIDREGSTTPAAESGQQSRAEAIDAPDDLGAALDATGLSDDRREAVRAMYDYLAEHGTARKSDFTDDVYPEHRAGYGSPGGWWNRLGKEALASLPGVEKPSSEGRPTWRFSE